VNGELGFVAGRALEARKPRSWSVSIVRVEETVPLAGSITELWPQPHDAYCGSVPQERVNVRVRPPMEVSVAVSLRWWPVWMVRVGSERVSVKLCGSMKSVNCAD